MAELSSFFKPRGLLCLQAMINGVREYWSFLSTSMPFAEQRMAVMSGLPRLAAMCRGEKFQLPEHGKLMSHPENRSKKTKQKLNPYNLYYFIHMYERPSQTDVMCEKIQIKK